MQENTGKDLDIVKFLVNNEAKINHSDAPALILAVRGGHFDVVKYLGMISHKKSLITIFGHKH